MAMLSSVSSVGSGQDPASPRPREAAQEQDPSLGLFHIGPVYITPTLRVGQIGIDSNVFYTATDRQADFVVDGGPGLELRVPMGSSVLFRADGGVNFLYFARTESQRRTTGYGGAELSVSGARTDLLLGGILSQTFRRPDFEVDERVLEKRREGRFELRRGLGRLTAVTGLRATRLELEEGSAFYGSDLARNLNRDTYRALAGVWLRLTPKTSFIVEADQQWDRFLNETSRDLDSNRLYGGFEVESTTRLAGRAVAGARTLRPKVTGVERWFPYVEVNLRYHIGPRTTLGAVVSRDQTFSAFLTSGDTQTSETVRYEGSLEKGLWGGLDIRFFGGLRQLETDGEIELIDPEGDVTVGVREDEHWRGGANLGYKFRNALRIGVEVSYSDRTSTFSDFGVDGLLVGFTLTYVPGNVLQGFR